MQSIHEALQTLARGAKLGSLETNAAGFIEVVFGDQLLSLYIKVAEESQIELSVRIDAFGLHPSTDLAQVLLEENGRRTIGRFAVDGTGAVVLGQRIEVAHVDAESLLAISEAFLHEVLLLEAKGAADLLRRAEQYTPPVEVPQEAMIRL